MFLSERGTTYQLSTSNSSFTINEGLLGFRLNAKIAAITAGL